MKYSLSFIITCIIWLISSNAHGALYTYQLEGKQLLQADFSEYFPQLYVFNAEGDLFFISGGMKGNAIGDLQDLMKKLDSEKLERLEKRQILEENDKWKEIFHRLSIKIQQPGFYDLLNKGKLAVIGIILSPKDYPHCRPCV